MSGLNEHVRSLHDRLKGTSMVIRGLAHCDEGGLKLGGTSVTGKRESLGGREYEGLARH